MKNHFRLLACAAAAFLLCPVFAVEVAESELQGGGISLDSVQFRNYAGPYEVFQTADAIRGIGMALGAQVAALGETFSVVAEGAKYSVIHAVDPQETGRLDADVLVFSADAGVDHISNVRRIIAGFLQEAYGYGVQDSDTIAVFITVYNAVYRGQMNVFTERYKDVVVKNLTAGSAGLSTDWQDWAGATQIVIPLTGVSGAVAVETSVISDENVVEALQKEEDLGVQVREELTQIKEREGENAGQKAKEAQQQAAQERKNGNQEKARESARVSSEQQNIADRKRTEVQNERKEIEKDKARIEKESVAVADTSSYVTGVFVADAKKGMYTLITVDASTGSMVKKSPVDTIANPFVAKSGSSYVAVCSVKGKKTTLRLCLIDEVSLEILKQAEESIAPGSPLLMQDERFYAVVQDANNYRVAAYDRNLGLVGKSEVNVSEGTALNASARGILVTGSDGSPQLLSPLTLAAGWGAGRSLNSSTSAEK